MDKQTRNILLIGLGLLVVVVLCVGAIAAGGVAFFALNRSQTSDNSIAVVEAPSNAEDSTEVETAPTDTQDTTEADTETRPPVQADVDLRDIFDPFWEAYDLLHQYYVDQPIDNQVLAAGAIEGLQYILDQHEIDLDSVQVPADADTAQQLSDDARTPREAEDAFLPFWEAWQQAEYADLGNDLTYQDLMHAALSFMVSSLGDPHTSYLNPTQYNDLITSLDGEYEGIGAYVDLTGEYVRIISPIKGAPAEEAGLKAGDLVVGVDGEDVTGLDGELVRSKILGPAGSKVVLTIQREGVEDPFDVEITRGKIVIPSVTSEMLDNNIAYVQLLVFGDDTTADLRVALEDLMAQNPDGLILDLRGNGGGYRDVAVSVTSEFLGDGVVLYQEYGDGSVDTFDVIPGGLATDIPLVVLVDEGTASASEILAGAIQDYERGTIVGTTTFGKGTVQLPLELSNSQGVVRITISRWLTPLERQINGVGIEPDHVVEITDADIEAELDPQLDYAIELLTSP